MAIPKNIRDYAIEEVKLALQDFVNRLDKHRSAEDFTYDLHCVSIDIVDEVLRIVKETA